MQPSPSDYDILTRRYAGQPGRLDKDGYGGDYYQIADDLNRGWIGRVYAHYNGMSIMHQTTGGVLHDELELGHTDDDGSHYDSDFVSDDPHRNHTLLVEALGSWVREFAPDYDGALLTEWKV